MLDPIGGFRRIQNFVINYVETSFRISNKVAAEARRNLLRTVDVLATEPLIEPVLRYESHPENLEQLAQREDGPLASLSKHGRRAFVELALSGLFEGARCEGEIRRKSIFAPYDHQVEMLKRGLLSGKPGIVTSRTGSGKTESFMLPVLAAISNEAVTWAAPGGGYLQKNWWLEDKGQWSARRQGENRPSGVRSLVIYPMNALVEDQMQRLRKTLDSDDAREVMQERFKGNRIFFGQYTSSTPVTGFECHPRIADNKEEKQRRTRRVTRLREAMRGFKRDQDAALAFDRQAELTAHDEGKRASDKTRYIFPALDGGEMLSRWDMQADPPDILVTNASMLGTMLSREVEESVFTKTRDWLLNNDDAYFYLVFDELHLIRGSAGTETAFLVKTLIQRLGLDQPSHRYKLRILASSASMPIDGSLGAQSLAYLRDLFAPYGTSQNANDPGVIDPEFWRDCIVVGNPHMPEFSGGRIEAQPFVDLLEAALEGKDGFVAKIFNAEALNPAVEYAARALGRSASGAADRIKALAESAAAVLTQACREGSDVRATSTTDLAERIFLPNSGDHDKALRGLLLARALPESDAWDSSVSITTPAFRVHTFIRNIEGLFASVALDGIIPVFEDFTVERGVTHAKPRIDGGRGRRLFELLYCEACGDLLIGGQRGQKVADGTETELLPSAADLDNMPEKVGSEYYDKMTLDEFAVFWPRRVQWAASDRDYDDWEAASLNPETGLVSIQSAVPSGHVGGYLYRQQEAAVKGRNGKMTGPLMAQPFCCPKCGTDYSNRPVFSRSRSPIRAFRTGVTKTSQLVATELFELLHAIGAEPKGIVFSDSRQDAANQALEIETLHLRDLRREVLVTAARELVKKSREEWIDPLEFGPLMASLATNPSEMALLVEKINKQLTSGTQKNSDRISLGKLLQCSADSSIGALTSDFVSLGVHPFDRLGKKHFEGKTWHDLFVQNGGRPAYSHKLNDVQKAGLNKEILKGQYELIDDVIFANTFFALEETGLAYPSIMDGNDEKADRLDTWLRVFAGAYRVLDNKFVEGDDVIEWLSGSDIKNKRVHRFAQVVFPGGGAIDGLSGILDELSTLGHPSGIIHIGKLYLKIAKESDPYWRCENCERVHLHRGPGRCTRCGEELGEQATGRAEELWRNNFLGSRIVRGQEEGVGRFRLRVEELTGQTDDFSDRLRKFKGIFVDGESEIQKRAQEIDMLSVTTTMEVGIDIGALQSVYQANMPPQRFNYQQRVGRAGRRGQAFSLVITFCRGRSHDAYYFAHPRAITGDPPPPPFLAIGHDPIPLRLVRKNWLRAAFKYLRDQCAKAGDLYPGDLVMPPDVHGEYISTQDYFHNPLASWPDRLHDALIKTLAERDSFIAAASFDPEQRNRLKEKSDVDHLIGEIGGLKTYAPNSEMGLARFLAEWGLLPMYGMPTRVRNLYLGLRPLKVGGTEDYEWSTMDRDLDLAVFEYAPGAVLVKDKQKHRVVGFTGSLSTPQGFKKDDLSIRALSHWYETETWVAVCKSCGSATRTDLIPQTSLKCDDCQAEIIPEELKRYVTPAGFRTDFNPKDGEEDVGRMSVRSMATLVSPGARLEHGNVTVMHGAGVTIMQMNDGVANIEGEGEGFLVQEASDLRVTMPSGTKKPPKIDGEPQAYEAGWLRNARSTSWGLARWGNIGNPLPPFGLISCKQTESVQLELGSFDPRLDLSHVARRGKYDRLSTRAAAISATQILVQRAALELDVSADEFEALEPRVRSGKPLLQIADALINGSGLCRRLGETVPGGSRPKILDILHDVLENQDQWPLVDFLNVSAEGDHSAQCHTSCYLCVQRYGNRRYHGLLDWRLGLAYLRSMTTPSYACGLEARDAAYPEIIGWRERAQWLAENIAQMRPGVLTPGNLPHSGQPFLLERKGGREIRYVIVHPLWSLDASALSDLLGNDWSPELRFVDTFNLERRPLKTMANWLKAR
ncbi:DEAD/DEAH box helicase [Pseudomonas sp. MAFF 730085]|uniref:DEAD/DEAH box helicase n=1 Tax=Pseudomonas kitaguniensis TaxID=2607908 RepID=A0A5N7JNF5_9PSED|nr:DEAD/DEAH box helicase [Pseudomonas kitaguniensis]